MVGVGVAFVACGEAESAPASCTDVELLVAASDYSSSVVCGAPGCVSSTQSTGADLGKDPQLAATNGHAFFLARDFDLVFEVDPACGTPKKNGRFSVHDLAPKDTATGEVRPANPHDAAIAPDGTVILPLYTAGRLAFVRNGVIESSLDLSGYDGDGNPQADAIRIVDVAGQAKAFVTLERLDDRDGLRSKQVSQMLRVDVATRTPEATIDLAGRNPFNPMAERGGLLYLAEPGNFDSDTDELAGIERFDTTTSTSQLLTRERDVGGSVAEIAIGDACGAAIVAGPEKDINPTWLVTFDPVSGKVLGGAPSSPRPAPILGPTPGYDLQGLAWRGNTLYVGDRRPGGSGYTVHVLEHAGDCNLAPTSRTIALPQRPVALRPAAGRR
jgi:hypothetical protein